MSLEMTLILSMKTEHKQGTVYLRAVLGGVTLKIRTQRSKDYDIICVDIL